MALSGWMASDFSNVQDAFIASLQYVARQIIFRKFDHYDKKGSGNPIEQFTVPVYKERAAIIWIEPFKNFDSQRANRMEPEALNIVTPFQVQGASAGVTGPSPDGVTIATPYGGDQIKWNGKIWVISDQVDPIQAGVMGPVAFWKTIMRYSAKSGQGTSPGA